MAGRRRSIDGVARMESVLVVRVVSSLVDLYLTEIVSCFFFLLHVVLYYMLRI